MIHAQNDSVTDNAFMRTRGVPARCCLFSLPVLAICATGAAPAEQLNPASGVGSPSPGEVRAIVESEFKGLFRVDDRLVVSAPTRTVVNPRYVTGDFNGDGVMDLAVGVRVSADVPGGDKSTPPFKMHSPWYEGMPQKEKDYYRHTLGDLAKYRDAWVLLTIHGDRKTGWRNTRYDQRFVVLNAGYSGSFSMRVHRGPLK